jgi:signal transduction histidine kinase
MHLLREAASLLNFRRRTLRVQLTLLYAGLFFGLSVALLGITNVVVLGGSSSSSVNAIANAQHGADVLRLEIGSLIALAVTFSLSVACGWLVAGRILRPLRTITSTARDISASNLHRRLALAGPDDEIKELGDTLDDLFERLETAFDSQRHFVANASHELRTPLTAERTILQVALADPDAGADTLRSACEEVLTLGEQQEALIASLLTLASSEGGIVQWERLDVAEIARKVAIDCGPEAERRGIRIDVSCTKALALGDPGLVDILVGNLMDNAIRHNMVGGQAAISTTTTGGMARISVSNTGPLIPLDAVDRLFLPFQQFGAERVRRNDGHGLGLAIVRAVANAHGANIAARARPQGGLDIEVTFPHGPVMPGVSSSRADLVRPSTAGSHPFTLRLGAEGSPAPMRAGDRDRDRALEILGEALAEGRLCLDEFSDRVEVLAQAKTLPELAALTQDVSPRRD